MAAAELKLQVGLDLAFFRQQLAQLASASVGYSLPINIDRLAIQKEITKLGRNISSRKYTLKIDTTVKSAASDIGNLQKALEELEKKNVNVQITGTGNLNPKEARRIRAALGRSVLSNGGKIKIPTTIQAAITKDDITAFKNAVKSKLAGISVDVKVKGQGRSFAETEHGYAGVMQYMQKEGLIGKTASGMTGQMGKNGDDIKQQLSDAVKSAEKIKSIFDGVAKSIATTGKSTANVQGKRLSLGNVPLMAGGVERRIEQSSAAIGSTLSADALKALYPEVSKTIASFVALKGQIQQNTSKLSGFSLILGLAAFAGVPLAKSVVKLTGSADSFAKLLDQLGLKLDAAFTKAAFNILSATSGRMLSGGSVAGLLPAAYRGIGPSAGPAGLLPPAYRGIGSSRNAGALPPAYRGLPFGFDFRGLPPKSNAMDEAGKLGPTVQQIRQRRLSSLRIEEAQVRDISGPFDVASSFNSSQKAASQRRLNKAVADFVKGLEDIASRAIAQKSIQQVNVADLGGVTRPALPGGRSPLMLPPAGGTTAGDRIRVSTGAYVGQPGFMQAPSIPSPVGGGGAPPAPPTPPGGGRGGFGSFGSFRGAMPNVSLPGAGLVREVGDQFGYAAQQVLLFGTTYKALAFLTDFPSKVGEAVAQLQTFRNTLQAITPNADEFQKSNQFILDTVDKYNTPLQSARDGFTNLYASMAPAGFKGDEIRNIFAGISQGAATFGMSADKVDRVNYAFAQMASKGQVMSEELKGQLGDVLPGAVAIFAKAAGFTGPNAMVDFTKAMEAGRYKGEAMKQLLINVGIVMKDKFAKGAEGAAQNFQGQMNAMANATKKLYEAFEPAGNLFSSKIIAPFASGLQVLADGFSAFFANTAAKTAGGFALSKELEKLRPTFQGLSENVKQFLPLLQSFATTALGLAKVLLQIASNPFVGYLARVYAVVLPLNIALNVMRGLWASNAIQLLVFNARIASGTSMLTAFKSMMATTGATSAATAAIIRGAFATTGIGLILVGLGLLIERFASMNQKLIDMKASALGAAEAIRGMSQTEARQEENKASRDVKVLETLLSKKNKGATTVAITDEQQQALERAGVRTGRMTPYGTMAAPGSGPEVGQYGQKAVDITQVQAALLARRGVASEASYRIKQLKFDEAQSQRQLPPIPGAGGDEASTRTAAAALASRQALADKLSSDQTKTDIERQKTLFENEKSMINMAYDLREARANSFQKETIRFQRELFNIEMERQKAVLDANSAVTKAQGAVAGGTGGATGLLQGSTGISSAAHFDVRRQDGGYISPQQARALFEASVAKQLQLTSTYGPRKAPVAGASTFHRGVDLAGPANTPLNLAQGYSMVGAGMKGGLGYTASVRGPQGEMYDVGHLQQPRAGVPSGKPTGRQKRVALAEQQTQNALQDRSVNLTLAEAQAYKKAEVATASYVASIVPIAEQELQNRLLENKISLTQAGVSPGLLSAQLAYSEQEIKTSAAIKVLNDDIAELSKVKGADGQITKEAQNQIDGYTAAIDKLKASLPISQVQHLTKSILEQANAIISKAATSKQARSDENRINELIISGLSREQAEAKLAAETLEKDYAVAIKTINDKIKEYSDTLAKLNLQKAAGIALDKGQIKEYERLREAIENLEKKKATAKGKKDEATSTPLPKEKTFKESITDEKAKISDQLKEMAKPANMLIGLAKQIGSSFSDAFVKVMDGTASAQEALAGFFKSIGDYLIQYGAQMLSLAIIKGILGLFGNGAAFDGGGITKNAKGNAFTGSGIAKFATGGIVNGPTLFPFADGGAMRMGLMGEAGPEAIMPLQRGPDGSLGVRAAMGGNGMGGSSSPILNMNFETSTINGVEYVSRDQLEAAMMQTRRQASSDGAKRGMAMTLDKIQQSPQTRRRIGM